MKKLILFLLFSISIYPQSILPLLMGDDAAFVPTDQSGLLGWYDFSDITTLALTDANIDSINDKSGNQGYASTPFTRPTSGVGQNSLLVADYAATPLKDVTFTGFTDVSNGFSIYIVAKFDATNNRTLIEMSDNTTPNRGFLFFVEANELKLRVAEGNEAIGAFTDVTNYKVFSFIHAPASRTSYVNGALLDNDANTQNMLAVPTILYIGVLANGSTYPMDGKIGEILIYLGTHTEAQRQKIETYLNEKWAIY